MLPQSALLWRTSDPADDGWKPARGDRRPRLPPSRAYGLPTDVATAGDLCTNIVGDTPQEGDREARGGIHEVPVKRNRSTGRKVGAPVWGDARLCDSPFALRGRTGLLDLVLPVTERRCFRTVDLGCDFLRLQWFFGLHRYLRCRFTSGQGKDQHDGQRFHRHRGSLGTGKWIISWSVRRNVADEFPAGREALLRARFGEPGDRCNSRLRGERKSPGR